MITAEELVEMTESKEQSPFKLGTVAELFENDTAKIKFDGEEEASEKRYSYLGRYSPVQGDRVLLAKVSGTYVIMDKIIYKKKPTIPGNKELIAGNMEAGYFGEVSTDELISGDDLASLVGITGGTSQHSTAGWLKFAYQGKIQFVAKKPIRYNVDGNYLASVVSGDKTIKINGFTYKIRLMFGINVASATSPTGAVCHGSEWNKLMLPIHVRAKDKSWAYPNNVEDNVPYWGINFTDNDLLTASSYGNGSYSWCQGSVSGRVMRGGSNGISYSTSRYLNETSNGFGWRPVLELIEG